MKKAYHISLSSHDEVMFRDDSDFNYGFNCLALATLETDSSLVAEGFLSTHFHSLLLTESPVELLRRTRYSYSRYFNDKYHRQGRLGQKIPFIIEVDGFYHRLAVVNYLNRQGLHHGIVLTPFAYPHCSVNSFFVSELGKAGPVPIIPERRTYRYLPKGVKLPSGWRMNASGLILREDVLEVPLVESMYGSSRNFLYQMNKLGDEVNREEQKNEKSTSPIVTLELIESGASADGMAQQFGNVKYNPHSITDTELCGLIDNNYLRRCSCADVIYDATLSERAYMYECISRDLWPMMHKSTSDAQLRRCLILGRER